jgi:hypothetical protein
MLASDDESLFLFAVEQFETMVQRFRERYYAEEFPLLASIDSHPRAPAVTPSAPGLV